MFKHGHHITMIYHGHRDSPHITMIHHGHHITMIHHGHHGRQMADNHITIACGFILVVAGHNFCNIANSNCDNRLLRKLIWAGIVHLAVSPRSY